MLQSKKITLLDPEKWDDRNDRSFLTHYKETGDWQTVLALCFTHTTETYHHWRVFTHGTDGACITFRKSALVGSLKAHKGIRCEPVTYKRITEVDDPKLSHDALPFLKRWPYKDEKEFRALYFGHEKKIVGYDKDGNEITKGLAAKDFDIDLSCIAWITLSPWMPESLAESLKTVIKSIPGCAGVKVYNTSLLENERWKNAGKRTKPRAS